MVYVSTDVLGPPLISAIHGENNNQKRKEMGSKMVYTSIRERNFYSIVFERRARAAAAPHSSSSSSKRFSFNLHRHVNDEVQCWPRGSKNVCRCFLGWAFFDSTARMKSFFLYIPWAVHIRRGVL